jgi:hypothetical protein
MKQISRGSFGDMNFAPCLTAIFADISLTGLDEQKNEGIVRVLAPTLKVSVPLRVLMTISLHIYQT